VQAPENMAELVSLLVSVLKNMPDIASLLPEMVNLRAEETQLQTDPISVVKKGVEQASRRNPFENIVPTSARD
jgi:hypothetical protein